MSFVALGSNLSGRFGAPADAVEAAIRMLESREIHLIGRSRLYRSLAWPDPSDPEFINAVAKVETELSSAGLLARLHRIETGFGRKRRQANAPRPLDLDIVDYGGQVSSRGDNPILPHPRMTGRAFVLLPLADIAPDWRHPATGTAIADLLRALPDPVAATPL